MLYYYRFFSCAIMYDGVVLCCAVIGYNVKQLVAIILCCTNNNKI